MCGALPLAPKFVQLFRAQRPRFALTDNGKPDTNGWATRSSTKTFVDPDAPLQYSLVPPSEASSCDDGDDAPRIGKYVAVISGRYVPVEEASTESLFEDKEMGDGKMVTHSPV